jgi:hypothetical protein
VGQELHLDFEVKPSGVQEAVTVVGEAPILDLSSARMAPMSASAMSSTCR